MRIKLTTIRELPDNQFDNWLLAVKPGMFWLDKDILLTDKQQEYEDSFQANGYTFSAITKVEILDTNKQED